MYRYLFLFACVMRVGILFAQTGKVLQQVVVALGCATNNELSLQR